MWLNQHALSIFVENATVQQTAFYLLVVLLFVKASVTSLSWIQTQICAADLANAPKLLTYKKTFQEEYEGQNVRIRVLQACLSNHH